MRKKMQTTGRRHGERHPLAKLTDREVELIREEYEQGGIGYGRLAAKWDVHKMTVRDIVTFRRRAG